MVTLSIDVRACVVGDIPIGDTVNFEICQGSFLEMLIRPVREAVNDRGLFTAGWFGVREKHCSWLEIYDRLRASEQV